MKTAISPHEGTGAKQGDQPPSPNEGSHEPPSTALSTTGSWGFQPPSCAEWVGLHNVIYRHCLMRGCVLNNAMDCRRLMRGKVQDMSSTAVANEGAD